MWDWLRRLLIRSRFDRYPDSFASNRTHLLDEIARAIDNSRQTSTLTLVVSHFTDTFLELQSLCEKRGLSYHVLSERQSPDQLAQRAIAHPGSVWLTLSPMLESAERMTVCEARCSFGIIACEWHPDWRVDQRLDQFSRLLPGYTRFAYFAALSDPTLRLVVPGQMIHLLKLMGLDDHTLITSAMISKRLRVFLKRLKPSKQNDWIDADSSAEWIAENL